MKHQIRTLVFDSFQNEMVQVGGDTNSLVDTVASHISRHHASNAELINLIHSEVRLPLELWLKNHTGKLPESNSIFILEPTLENDPETRTFDVQVEPIGFENNRYWLISILEITKSLDIVKNLKDNYEGIFANLASASIGTWTYDVRFNMHVWSLPALEILGLSKQSRQMPLKKFLEFFSNDEDVETFQDLLDSAIKTGKAFEATYKLTNRNRQNIEIKLCCFPFLDQNGNTQKIQSNLIDLTKTEDRQIGIEQLAMVAQKTTNAVIITDRNGKIEWVNEGFTRMTEYELDEVIGRKPGSLLQGPDSSPDAIESLRQAVRQATPVEVDIVNYSKSGRRYWVDVKLQPITNSQGKVDRFMALELDVTATREQQQKMFELNSALEETIISKNRLFSVIGHDLRAPFNGLIGLTKILKKEASSMEQEEIQEIAGILHNSAKATLELLEKLLTWSKSETGDLKAKPTSYPVKSIVDDALNILNQSLEAKKITVKHSGEQNIWAYIDQSMIASVIQNLLSNAIKFSHPGGTINIDYREERSQVYLTIEDQGVGISESNLKKLFTVGSDTTSLGTAGEKGSGLGLLLSKSFVEKNSGSISVKSEENKGTAFIIELPRESQTVSAVKHHHLLVVDDDPQFHVILKSLLKRLGFNNVTCVKTSREASNIISSRPIALAIVDCNMPDGSGPELVRKLKHNGIKIPTIGISNQLDDSVVSQWNAVGVTKLLDKKFDEEILRLHLSELGLLEPSLIKKSA